MKECGKCGTCFEDEIGDCPVDGTPARLSLPGTRLLAKRYLLVKRLGKGAMGQVYLANDRNLGTREVAVKTVRQDILNSDDLGEGEAIARFEREAKSAASIRHPHIVDVTDFGESEEGVFFLVMEYVEGETLHRLLRREGTLPIRRAVAILRQIADGVDAAHEIGILHRDLKPANIFIMQRKQQRDGFVKVGDFGLAKIINQTATHAGQASAPSSRGIVGTPEFMAPEQMQPELGVDVRCDLYALGTIAFVMLTGRTPFTGDLMELVMQKVIHDPPHLNTLREDIPKDVADVIMSALARDPATRPNSVAEWIGNLESAASDVDQSSSKEKSLLTVHAPEGSEIYLNDERKGSIGSSGRIILRSVPAGTHILRVAKTGEKDDERVIEIREDGEEQVIHAQLKHLPGSKPSPSQGTSSSGVASSMLPGIVACRRCGSRFAEGVQFCGRCGGREFGAIAEEHVASNATICQKCGVQLPGNAKFCGRCGSVTNTQPLQPVGIVCKSCGTNHRAGTKFCGKCGRPMV
ncbi:MAG: protein kinase [Pyrinomonadaceae bacterium]